MSSMEVELKLLFPTIMRYKPNETRFVGIFKTLQHENIFASFNVPNYPNALGITFETGISINETIYQSLITKSDTINFLEFLKLFNQVIINAPKQRIFNRRFFSRFYHEFGQLRQRCRLDHFIFDNKNEILKIIHTDAFSIKNEIVIKLNYYEEDSQVYDVIKHNFPSTHGVKLFHKQYSLLFLYKQFLSVIKSLEAFHETLQKIDSVCWVIAPRNPTPEHEFRTIVIADNNVSVKLTFNPWKMSEVPEFKFFESSNIIQQYKDNLSKNLNNWDRECDILQNILKVLDLPLFPVKPLEIGSTSAETKDVVIFDSESECCICFSYHLDEDVSIIQCDNELCRRYFHHQCLYNWLSKLPNNVFFSSITGPCPNCEKTISCKILEK